MIDVQTKIKATNTVPAMATTRIREVVVTATEDALNAAVAEHQIEPDKIISVIFQPGRAMAIGDYKAKYRLIYRTWVQFANIMPKKPSSWWHRFSEKIMPNRRAVGERRFCAPPICFIQGHPTKYVSSPAVIVIGLCREYLGNPKFMAIGKRPRGSEHRLADPASVRCRPQRRFQARSSRGTR